jgi:hypothetical protein
MKTMMTQLVIVYMLAASAAICSLQILFANTISQILALAQNKSNRSWLLFLLGAPLSC